MWLERGQNLSGRIPEELSQIPNQIQALPSINPVSYSLPLVALVSQQQGHAISLEDMQKAIQNALVQQKTENQSLPRGPPPSLQTEKGMENYRLSQYLNNLGIFSTEDLERNYPIKPFQKPRPERIYSSNQNARIDRIESKVDEIGQMTSQFGRMMLENQSKKPVAKSNLTHRYFPPLIPSQSQYASPDSDDNEDSEGEYNEEENRWHAPSHQPETYNELLPKLSPAMRKMCQSHIVQEKESKSYEWFSSLQYLHCNINDLLITNSFLDSASEFWGVNDATINALGWKADKPSDFAIKSNSKNISESLGWYTDVPISVKDKDGKIVTSTGNFARINNGESEPMLCLGMTWIRKVQGILDPNKNQFRMKLHGRSFIIPTFSKTPEVSRSKDAIAFKDLVQVSTISSSSTNKEDLKKNMMNLKNES
ncbi:hypothetical protein C2G38_2198543 [Gigaspora rosea]|uniref:Uncharacterized protein n=1 Tax=Gigaspora rosea TaxID=44941 RepID=A0A397UU90_9GLOM|nr:hypothetical protein C2G38_2198543 [Gigaspora rosea]